MNKLTLLISILSLVLSISLMIAGYYYIDRIQGIDERVKDLEGNNLYKTKQLITPTQTAGLEEDYGTMEDHPKQTAKITAYCQYCNDGTGTSLGKPCSPEIIASDPDKLPYGSIIVYEGKEKEMGDLCGASEESDGILIIDEYHYSTKGYCDCAEVGNRYAEVWIKE